MSNAIISMNSNTRQKDRTSERSRVRVIHGLNFEIDGRSEIDDRWQVQTSEYCENARFEV